MNAITQTADYGIYIITRGYSQMLRVPQKINDIVEILSYGYGQGGGGGQELAESYKCLLLRMTLSRTYIFTSVYNYNTHVGYQARVLGEINHNKVTYCHC